MAVSRYRARASLLFAAVGMSPVVAAGQRPPSDTAALRYAGAPPLTNDGLLRRPARLSITNASLARALTALQDASGISIAFSDNLLPTEQTRSCACRNATIGEALDRLLAGTSLRYEAFETLILVVPSRALKSHPSFLPAETLVALEQGIDRDFEARTTRLLGHDQQRLLVGTVIDEGGRAIPSAVVAVVGSTIQTITDPGGRFRLTIPNDSTATVRVAAIGYRPLTATVRLSDSPARLVLIGAPVNLDAIVVTGTPGEQQVRALGNAVARLSAPDIVEAAAATNVSALLNARAAGVVTQSSSGAAGGGSRIMIRGRGSIQFVGDPLIYVDGVRVNNDLSTSPAPGGGTFSRLDDVDPNDIESVEIIKGPSAATLYGTEASGGVIQIITKHGRSGRGVFAARLRQGFSRISDPREAAGVWWGRDLSSGDEFTWSAVDQLGVNGSKLFRTGHTQGYDVDVNGGSDAMQYFLSGAWDRDEGITPNDLAKKLRSRANLNLQPRQNFDIRASVGVTNGRTDTFDHFYFYAARYFIPTLRKTPAGGFISVPPDVVAKTQKYYQDLNHVTGSIQLNHRPTRWLAQRLTTGVDYTNERNTALIAFVPDQFSQFYSPADRLGSKSIQQVQTGLTTLDYSATASYSPTKNLSAKTSGGLQYYRKVLKLDNLAGLGFPAPGVSSVSGTTGRRTAGEDQVENATVGVFVQQEISWRDRLFVTGALRADDNSAFGANFDLVTYPKVSTSWVAIEDQDRWLSTLRFRAAYGESGQQPDAFAALRAYAAIPGHGDRAAGTPSFVGNPDLGPERGREIEVGVDAALRGSRATASLTYYYRRTTRAIVSREIAPSTGFPERQFINAGQVDGKGIEASISGRPIESRRLAWDLTVNFARNFNKVITVDVPGIDAIPIGFIPNLSKPGYPVSGYFGKKAVSAALGANGRATNVTCSDGNGGTVPCTQAPSLFLGQNYPHTQASVASTWLLFNRLRVYAFADLALGRSYFSADKVITCAFLQSHEINFHPERFDPLDVATCQLAGGLGFFDSGTILRADFAKLREVSVSYTLPAKWSRSVGASEANLTLATRNLLTLWRKDRGPFKTPDPEVFTDGNYGASINDEAGVPLPRQLLAVVKVTF